MIDLMRFNIRNSANDSPDVISIVRNSEEIFPRGIIEAQRTVSLSHGLRIFNI